MKKIITLFLVLLGFVALLGCDSNAEATKSKKELANYFENQEVMTVDDFDAKMTESFDVSSSLTEIDNTKLDNTKVTFSSGGVAQNYYLWQKDKKVYFSMQAAEETNVFYVDLTTLKTMLGASLNQSGLGNKPSELIEATLAEISHSIGFTETLKFNDILAALTFTGEDFDYVEKGKFVLKDEVLLNKVVQMSSGNIDAEELKDSIKEEGVTAHLYIYFNGTEITDYELVLNVSNEEVQETSTIKLSFVYNESELKGFGISITATDFSFQLQIGYVNDVLSISFVLSKGDKYEINLNISDKLIDCIAKKNNQQFLKANLSLNGSTANNLTTYQINGEIIFNGQVLDAETGNFEINLLSNQSLQIPNDIQGLESSAINLLEQQG